MYNMYDSKTTYTRQQTPQYCRKIAVKDIALYVFVHTSEYVCTYVCILVHTSVSVACKNWFNLAIVFDNIVGWLVG